ncbi:coagulation factor XIII A chain-like [Pholidichthys leucotaenia]
MWVPPLSEFPTVEPLTTMSGSVDRFTGRFNHPPSDTNLFKEPDLSAVEPAEGSAEAEATPRGYYSRPTQPPASGLMVQYIDMMKYENERDHHTHQFRLYCAGDDDDDDMDQLCLVVRRGQPFNVKVTFNRTLTSVDEFQLEFRIGQYPAVNKRTMVVVPFFRAPQSSWTGKIFKAEGNVVILTITPAANAIVGKFQMYMAFFEGNHSWQTQRNTKTDVYILFNPWAKDDSVFISTEAEREEYVMNENGLIYRGSHKYPRPLFWEYGQFQKGILDICISLLDASKMSISSRSDPIKVSRRASALLNSQDDHGVLVGNWSGNYSGGTFPGYWSSSVDILYQYAETRFPVAYAQCWVFAGVFNTFLRCLGIPARVVTNYDSGHDTGDLTIEYVFDENGRNYHCWNEANMQRPELLGIRLSSGVTDLGGWQVVDCTPQESSEGMYRCGPTSVIAIKYGHLQLPFDGPFVFAEVNADVAYLQKDKYGNLTVIERYTDMIGKLLLTKSIGRNDYTVITNSYKFPEGSLEDQRTMKEAKKRVLEQDDTVKTEALMTIKLDLNPTFKGQPLNLDVTVTNGADVDKQFDVSVDVDVIYYTGVVRVHLKDVEAIFSVKANSMDAVTANHGCVADLTHTLLIQPQEYKYYLKGEDYALKFTGVAVDKTDGQKAYTTLLVELDDPEMTMELDREKVLRGEATRVTVEFTNTFPEPLDNVKMMLISSGIIPKTEKYHGTLEPGASVQMVKQFTPRRIGSRRIRAALQCDDFTKLMTFPAVAPV